MRSLVLSLVLGLAAVGSLALPAVAEAHPYGGYGGYGRTWHGGSHYRWQGGSHYWRGGSHYRLYGGSHYYYPGYYNYNYYTPNFGVYTVPSPVYQYSPGAAIYYNSGYPAYYP